MLAPPAGARANLSWVYVLPAAFRAGATSRYSRRWLLFLSNTKKISYIKIQQRPSDALSYNQGLMDRSCSIKWGKFVSKHLVNTIKNKNTVSIWQTTINNCKWLTVHLLILSHRAWNSGQFNWALPCVWKKYSGKGNRWITTHKWPHIIKCLSKDTSMRTTRLLQCSRARYFSLPANTVMHQQNTHL